MMTGSNRRLSLNVLNIYQKYKTSHGTVPRAVPPDELIIQYLSPAPGWNGTGSDTTVVMSRLVISRLSSQKLVGSPLGIDTAAG